MKKVAVIMGSDSDLPVVSKAADTLKRFGVPYEMHVFSAHRTPAEAKTFAENARANGFGAIIAAAGALPPAKPPCAWRQGRLQKNISPRNLALRFAAA